MKKLLIVRAHPYGSDRSRSMQLADAFLAGFRETHPDALVEDINLYTAAVPEIDIDLPCRDSDAMAPTLDDRWSVVKGEWLTGAAGLRYRFCTYLPQE